MTQAIFHTAKDAFGSSRGADSNAVGRLSGHRHQDAEARSQFAGRQADREYAAQPIVGRFDRAICRLAGNRSRNLINPSVWLRRWATARRTPTNDAHRAFGAIFAARYAAGEPQVVWTTLVADLETPVSAYLKVAGARRLRADELPAGIRSRAAPCAAAIRSSGSTRISFFASTARTPRSIARPRPTRRLRAGQRAAADGLARPDRREPHRAAGQRCRRWLPAFSAISAMTWCG